MSPVSLRSALPSGRGRRTGSLKSFRSRSPLMPLRKKSTAKDIGPPNSSSPQVVKKPPVISSEEWSSKRPSDDGVSMVSSLHSSPTASPQGSPRKVGGVVKSQNCSQMNLSGSSSSLTSDASTRVWHRQPAELRHRWGSPPQEDPADDQAARPRERQGEEESDGGRGGGGGGGGGGGEMALTERSQSRERQVEGAGEAASSSSSSPQDERQRQAEQRARRRGYALLPPGKADNLSDSSHSEISSRSSICSVDSVPAPGSDDRCNSGRICAAAATTTSTPPAAAAAIESTPAPHAHLNSDNQPSTSSSSSPARGYVSRGSTFTSSISTEELTPDHASLDSVADSGRGSWTSCSSNSHDSFQSLPASSCRPWDHGIHGLPLPLPHTHLGGFKQHAQPPIAEVDAAASASSSTSRHHSRGSGSDLSNESRQSWASSGSLSDTYEGSYGTIKRRNTSEHPSSPTEEDGGQSTDPVYKTVTSSTEKGLIVYCVTSPSKDERYRAPPPTPPGYQGLALGDLGLTDGVVPLPRPPHLRPPDYSVALQRSKLLQSPGAAGGLAEARRLVGNHHLHRPHQEATRSRPPSICLPTQELVDSEDDEQVSAV
ncbi:rap guanine nucleotide exchange factor 6-like [Cebidichthys violaceus]|uniref:rap guanine nucleotide exchange factor 6-like n=1 Tax=Cebidichthys violaceus TaxID=271503 RepID=UPI0035CA12EE